MSKDGTRLGSLKQVVELRERIAQLERENAELREALKDAANGMALAYETASKKFIDETLLHLGVHEARARALLK